MKYFESKYGFKKIVIVKILCFSKRSQNVTGPNLEDYERVFVLLQPAKNIFKEYLGSLSVKTRFLI